jgi:hypothetical protein
VSIINGDKHERGDNMKNCRRLIFMSLLLVLPTLSWGADQAGGQEAPDQIPNKNSMPMRQITNQQRQEAAARQAARRAAHGQRQQGGPTTQQQVPQLPANTNSK